MASPRVSFLFLLFFLLQRGISANLASENEDEKQIIEEKQVEDETKLELQTIALKERNEENILDCVRDRDCQPLQICNISTLKCSRKEIFPMTLQELIGSLLILTIVGVGQAAGIGGGVILVTLLMQFFEYESKKSIALVFVTLFAASSVNLFKYLRQTCKDGGPVIDYKIVLISLPTIMVGSVYGVSFNKFLPTGVIGIMLVFFILLNIRKTYQSYHAERAKELQENKEELLQDHSKSLKEISSLPKTKHSPQYPKVIIRKIIFITLGFISFSLLRGGKKFDSLLDIPACGVVYHICNLAILYLSFLLVKAIIAEFSKEQQSSSSELSQEFQQSPQEMQKFALWSALAGFIGAILGIGGGMILIPKWLELRVPAQKTSACSVLLVFLTAFNSVIQFSLSGAFFLEEYLFFTILAFLSSFLVSQAIQEYVKKHNRISILIQIIFAFLILALLVFTFLIALESKENPGILYSFGEFC